MKQSASRGTEKDPRYYYGGGNGGQFQVVIGNHVADVFLAVTVWQALTKKRNRHRKMMIKVSAKPLCLCYFRYFYASDRFEAATGILKGMLALALTFQWTTNKVVLI